MNYVQPEFAAIANSALHFNRTLSAASNSRFKKSFKSILSRNLILTVGDMCLWNIAKILGKINVGAKELNSTFNSKEKSFLYVTAAGVE